MYIGDWAGQSWSQDPTCSAKAPTCQEYVQNNPKAFTEAYWKINALKVYSSDGSTSSPEPAQGVAPVPAQQPQQPAQVFTQVVAGPPVTITVNARSTAPTHGAAEAPVDTRQRGLLSFEGQREASQGSSSEPVAQRRRRSRSRRHLAEHIASATGQYV